ncbi:hypothetical protein [Bradyrhizobium tropiciagri]|uniref:hypothetical protein n=1 Tax=Bradyrhizobium tropiciagri TaxID=312253 RepID=UPI001009D0D8|nr:hypothetical protein [Bradyrhizobium tropiciagri]
MITRQRDIVGTQQSGDGYRVIRWTIVICRWIAVTIWPQTNALRRIATSSETVSSVVTKEAPKRCNGRGRQEKDKRVELILRQVETSLKARPSPWKRQGLRHHPLQNCLPIISAFAIFEDRYIVVVLRKFDGFAAPQIPAPIATTF